MFNREEYAKRIEEIRNKMLLSKNDMAKLLDMSSNTYSRVLDVNNQKPLTFRVMRSIKEFCEKHKDK